MAKPEVTITCMPRQTIYGLWQKSNDKTISRDIKSLSQRYHTAVSLREGEVIPYIVLSRNYEEQSGDFELLTGSTIENENPDVPSATFSTIPSTIPFIPSL